MICASDSAVAPRALRYRPQSRRGGFTLIELSVAVAVTSILFAMVLPGLQESRHRESLRQAESRIKDIATAALRFHAATGSFPDGFQPLKPHLDLALWSALVNDQPLDGSQFRLKVVGNDAIELFTEIDNPLRVTQTLSMRLDSKAAAAFQQSGELPAILAAADPAAVALNARALQGIMDSGVAAVMCEGDFSESEARQQIDLAWSDSRNRQVAWGLLDANDDGFVSKSEVYDIAWEDGFSESRECIAAFKDFTSLALAFDADEPDYTAPVELQAAWHHALLARMYRQVDDIRQADGAHREFRQLVDPLDKIGVSLRTAQPTAAVDIADVFRQKLEALVRGKVVSADLADPAIGTASFFQTSLIFQLFTDPQRSFPDEFAVRLHVDWRANSDDVATGSQDDPFPDLVSALAYAEDQNFPAVEMIVHPGVYHGALEITRDTRIIGEEDVHFVPLSKGHVVNHGPFVLEIDNMGLTSTDDVPGVIRVSHPFAATYLENVTINGALGFAVHQTGGEFQCTGLSVNRTVPFSADMGIAVQFDGGAFVELKDVEMVGNDGGALLLSDTGTEVHVTRLAISRTRANPFALDQIKEEIRGHPDYDPAVIQPGTCAVDVRSGAFLEGRYLRITENEYVGLIVHDLGRAVFSDSDISYTLHTRQLPDTYDFAHAVAVLDRGSLDMSTFTVSHATVGIYIDGEIEVDLRSPEGMFGFVSNCYLGISLGDGLPPDFDLDLLEQSVLFQDNTVKVRGAALPLPPPTAPIELHE